MAGRNTSNIIVRTPRIPQSIFGHGRLLPTPPGLPHPSTHPYYFLRDFGAAGGGGVGRGREEGGGRVASSLLSGRVGGPAVVSVFGTRPSCSQTAFPFLHP